MATPPSRQFDKVAFLYFGAQRPELFSQFAGSFLGFEGGQVPVERVRDAVDLHFAGAVVGWKSLSWSFVQRFAGLDLQRIAATRATRVQRCTDVVLRYRFSSNATQQLSRRVVLLLHGPGFCCSSLKKKADSEPKAVADSQSANFDAMACPEVQ
jgi:hypothetical protein